MKQFNIETETVAVETYEFAGNQSKRAIKHNVTRVFRFRDIHGNVKALPNYIKNAIESAGFTAVYLGGTTYDHSVIGLTAI